LNGLDYVEIDTALLIAKALGESQELWLRLFERQEDVCQSFIRGWKQAMAGECKPIEELWKDIEGE
jgi:hypothetical protein